LGHIAKERLENSDDSDYVDLESLLK